MSFVVVDPDDFVRWGLLSPLPGRPVRRILRLPPDPPCPAPPQAMCWSGEHRLPIPIFSRRPHKLQLLGYCRRGDAWVGGPPEPWPAHPGLRLVLRRRGVARWIQRARAARAALVGRLR